MLTNSECDGRVCLWKALTQINLRKKGVVILEVGYMTNGFGGLVGTGGGVTNVREAKYL